MDASDEMRIDEVARVRGRWAAIVQSELERLARKRPELTERQLGIVAETLASVLDRLLGVRLDNLAVRRPDLVRTAVRLVDPEPVEPGTRVSA